MDADVSWVRALPRRPARLLTWPSSAMSTGTTSVAATPRGTCAARPATKRRRPHPVSVVHVRRFARHEYCLPTIDTTAILVPRNTRWTAPPDNKRR